MASRAPAVEKPKSNSANYYSLLTPTLHGRFSKTAQFLLAACQAEGFFLNEKSSFFWALLPFSRSGLKAILMFLTLMPILILRITQQSAAPRSGVSPAEKIAKAALSPDLYRTLAYYIGSAWVYVQIYLWSFDASDDLGITTRFASYERPRVNERYLYLSAFSIHAAVVYAIYHLASDVDHIVFTSETQSTVDKLKKKFFRTVDRTLKLTLLTVCTAPVSYFTFRSLIWSITVRTVGVFVRLHADTSKHANPMSSGIFFRTMSISLLMFPLWQLANMLYTIYFSQDPVHDGITISEKSADPNGALITGIKMTRKPIVQVMAFMELAYIAEKAPARRVKIFTDTRAPVTIWQSIQQECLLVINSITASLTGALDTVKAPSSANSTPQTSQTSVSPALSTPTPSQRAGYALGSSPISHENILLSPLQKSPGGAWHNSPQKLPMPDFKKLADKGGTLVQGAKIEEKTQGATDVLLNYQYIGDLFRTTIQAKTQSLLPTFRLQSDAIRSLRYFIVASLTEDEYGTVQTDLPTMLGEMCAALGVLKKYKADPPLHWTDVEALADKGKGKKIELPEVDVLIGELMAALGDIEEKFRAYMPRLKLPPNVLKTLNEARAAKARAAA